MSTKVEEFGVISNTRLINTCSTIIKNKFNYAFPSPFDFPYRSNSILECEFYLLENMDCCLVVFQPYRPLVQYTQDLGQGLEEAILPLAWRIVNDSMRTDVCLLYPPFLIALACGPRACRLRVLERAGCGRYLSGLGRRRASPLPFGHARG